VIITPQKPSPQKTPSRISRIKLSSQAWTGIGTGIIFILLIIVILAFIVPRINNGKAEESINPPETSMVLIPAGEFQMGSNDGHDYEKPVHTVYLNAFYIDKYEVTNAQYKKFVKATGHKGPEGYSYVNGNWQNGFKPWTDPNFNGDDQPVGCVSWKDAKAYAKWARKRLPTEAEWEKAARGGLVGKKYSWGNTLTHDAANYGGTGGKDKWEYTSPVGSFSPNGYGLYDMAGNVWEWCADRYDSNYYANSPKSNPKGPIWGSYRVYRGGGWAVNSTYDFSSNLIIPTYRIIGWSFCVADRGCRGTSFTAEWLGFRCAK
jgi:formylglycine-generating enzyme required for sulfatase activity